MKQIVLFACLFLCVFGVLGQDDIRPTPGGITQIDLATADDFTLDRVNSTAYFAIDEINKKVEEGTLEFADHTILVPLELAEILKATSQITSGVQLTYTIDISTLDSEDMLHTYQVIVGYQEFLPEPRKLIRTIFVE